MCECCAVQHLLWCYSYTLFCGTLCRSFNVLNIHWIRWWSDEGSASLKFHIFTWMMEPYIAVRRKHKEKGPFLGVLVNIQVWCVWHILQWIHALRLCVSSFPIWIGLKNFRHWVWRCANRNLCILYRQAIGNLMLAQKTYKLPSPSFACFCKLVT